MWGTLAIVIMNVLIYSTDRKIHSYESKSLLVLTPFLRLKDFGLVVVVVGLLMMEGEWSQCNKCGLFVADLTVVCYGFVNRFT